MARLIPTKQRLMVDGQELDLERAIAPMDPSLTGGGEEPLEPRVMIGERNMLDDFIYAPDPPADVPDIAQEYSFGKKPPAVDPNEDPLKKKQDEAKQVKRSLRQRLRSIFRREPEEALGRRPPGGGKRLKVYESPTSLPITPEEKEQQRKEEMEYRKMMGFRTDPRPAAAKGGGMAIPEEEAKDNAWEVIKGSIRYTSAKVLHGLSREIYPERHPELIDPMGEGLELATEYGIDLMKILRNNYKDPTDYPSLVNEWIAAEKRIGREIPMEEIEKIAEASHRAFYELIPEREVLNRKSAELRDISREMVKLTPERTQQRMQAQMAYISDPKNWRPENAENLAHSIWISALANSGYMLLAAVPYAGMGGMVLAEKGAAEETMESVGIEDPEILSRYAGIYGVLSGVVETKVNQWLMGPLAPLGKSKAGAAVKGAMGKASVSGVITLLGNVLGKAAGEGLEEGFQGTIQDLITFTALGEYYDKIQHSDPVKAEEIGQAMVKLAQEDHMSKRLKEFLGGAAVGLLFGAASAPAEVRAAQEVRAREEIKEKAVQKKVLNDLNADLAKERASLEEDAATPPVPPRTAEEEAPGVPETPEAPEVAPEPKETVPEPIQTEVETAEEVPGSAQTPYERVRKPEGYRESLKKRDIPEEFADWKDNLITENDTREATEQAHEFGQKYAGNKPAIAEMLRRAREHTSLVQRLEAENDITSAIDVAQNYSQLWREAAQAALGLGTELEAGALPSTVVELNDIIAQLEEEIRAEAKAAEIGTTEIEGVPRAGTQDAGRPGEQTAGTVEPTASTPITEGVKPGKLPPAKKAVRRRVRVPKALQGDPIIEAIADMGGVSRYRTVGDEQRLAGEFARLRGSNKGYYASLIRGENTEGGETLDLIAERLKNDPRVRAESQVDVSKWTEDDVLTYLEERFLQGALPPASQSATEEAPIPPVEDRLEIMKEGREEPIQPLALPEDALVWKNGQWRKIKQAEEGTTFEDGTPFTVDTFDETDAVSWVEKGDGDVYELASEEFRQQEMNRADAARQAAEKRSREEGAVTDERIQAMPWTASARQANKSANSVKEGTPGASEELKRRKPIVDRLQKVLDIPVRFGRILGTKARAIYKTKSQVIRLKLERDIETLAHEAGHHLEQLMNFKKVIAQHSNEVQKMAYPGADNLNAEGFAEFVRLYVTNREAAQRAAPEFYEEFTKQLESFPEVSAMLDQTGQDYKDWLDQPAIAKVKSVISTDPERKRRMSYADLMTWAIDDLYPIRKFVDEVTKGKGTGKVSEDPYVLSRLLVGNMGKADAFLRYGTLDTEWNVTGEPLEAILGPIEKRGALDDFRAFAVALRAVELAQRGIYQGIESKVANEAVETLLEANPEFKEEFARVRSWQDSVLQYLVDSGVKSERAKQAMDKMNVAYVPFYKAVDKNQKGVGKSMKYVDLFSPVKRIGTSELEIVDPFESMIKNLYTFMQLAENNRIAQSMAKLANLPGAGKWIEPIPTRMVAREVDMQRIGEELEKRGIEIDPDALDEIIPLFEPKLFSPEENIISILADGQRQYYEVDPSLYQAVEGLNKETRNWLTTILGAPARALRAGATLTPEFGARNPIRDQITAFIYSEYGFKPGVDLIRGIAHAIKADDTYWQWKIAGGEHAALTGLDRTSIQKDLQALIKNGALQKVTGLIRNPIEALRMLNEFGEAGTRLGEFAKGIKAEARKGVTGREAMTKAAFASREVSQDFAKMGSYVRAVNQIVPFFGAKVGGYAKLAKELKTHPERTIPRIIGAVTIPSLVLMLYNRRDKRWEDIPQWQKDLFWIVMTKDHIYRIPKPFELGVAFGSIPERTVDAMIDKDPRIGEEVLKTLTQIDAPNPLAVQALVPLAQNWQNRKWTGAPIVPESLKRLEPGYQATEYTSETAKIIGQWANYPPAKIDNLIRGYFGGLGQYGLDITDETLRAIGVTDEEKRSLVERVASSEPIDWPLIRAFVVRYPTSNTDQVSDFYDTLTSARAKKQTYSFLADREGEKAEAKAREYKAKHISELQSLKHLEGISKQLSDYRKKMQKIDSDPTIRPADRREQMKDLQQKMVELVRDESVSPKKELRDSRVEYVKTKLGKLDMDKALDYYTGLSDQEREATRRTLKDAWYSWIKDAEKPEIARLQPVFKALTKK